MFEKIICYDSLLQVPFCEDESVQLFRVAFFRSDFLQNPYFSWQVKVTVEEYLRLIHCFQINSLLSD